MTRLTILLLGFLAFAPLAHAQEAGSPIATATSP